MSSFSMASGHALGRRTGRTRSWVVPAGLAEDRGVGQTDLMLTFEILTCIAAIAGAANVVADEYGKFRVTRRCQSALRRTLGSALQN
jgi:hypothetical protein